MSMELRLIIKLILGALCAGLVFLGPADRLYDLYGFGLNKTLRVLILSVMLAYFLVTGLRFTRHGFIFGRFVLLFLFIAFIYCFYSPSLSTSFVSFSKALLWTLASVCTYRLRLYGHITDRFLYFSVCLAIPLACFFSLFAKFFGGLETSQNVGAYGLIWFFPLLMLSAKGSTNV